MSRNLAFVGFGFSTKRKLLMSLSVTRYLFLAFDLLISPYSGLVFLHAVQTNSLNLVWKNSEVLAFEHQTQPPKATPALL